MITGITKTHQRRSIPIPGFLADELANLIAGKAPGDFLFTAPEGGVAAQFEQVCTDCRDTPNRRAHLAIVSKVFLGKATRRAKPAARSSLAAGRAATTGSRRIC